MASVVVLDSAFKRTTVKVTPATHMRDVLEQACKTRKISPELYALKSKANKTVDLSQPFRLSGLTNGATLTLIQASRSASVVSVALQLPDSEGGGRLSDKFPSTTSLWLVLRKYEDAVAGQPPRKLNLTQRAVPYEQTANSGRLEYEQPCLHLMGRNLESFVDLQKTLAQLGLNSGSVLIRLSFKCVGQPLEEAMQEIEQYFKGVGVDSSAPAPASVAGTDELNGDSPMPDADTAASNVDSGDVAMIKPVNLSSAQHELSPEDTLSGPQLPSDPTSFPTVERTTSTSDATNSPTTNSTPGISVYLPPSNTVPAASLEEEDPQTFEPSIDHAKAHQAAINRMTQNKRLLSDKELAEQAAAQEAALSEVKTVIIRVKYPDQSMIETEITAETTPSDLYAKVNSTLASPDAVGKFQLRFMGSKGMQELPNVASKRLVKNFGFRGKVLITVVWNDDASAKIRESPCLKQELMSVAKDLKVELGNQREEGEASHKLAMEKKSTTSGTSGKSGKNSVDFEKKMKKLLGFGKK